VGEYNHHVPCPSLNDVSITRLSTHVELSNRSALSDDVVSRNLKLVNGTVTGGDLVINSDLVTIPEGSVAKFGTFKESGECW